MKSNREDHPFCIVEHFPHLWNGDKSASQGTGEWNRVSIPHCEPNAVQKNLCSQEAAVSLFLSWPFHVGTISNMCWSSSSLPSNKAAVTAVAAPGFHFPRGNGFTILPSEGQTDMHLPVLEEALYKSLGSKYLLPNSQRVCSRVWAEHTLKSDSWYVSKYNWTTKTEVMPKELKNARLLLRICLLRRVKFQCL